MRHLDAAVFELIDRMAAGQSGPVAIAVSGGSDSLALLFLAHEWANRSGRDLLVLTVDHGLRPEAADEAAFVARQASALGHSSQVLNWSGEKPTQRHARYARHALLAEAAREADAGLLLLGHTRDDLEETLLMRLAHGSPLTGAAGLQFVSVSPVWPEGRGILLGRPLLTSRRAALQAWLSEAGQSWVRDPSNEADHYERVRTRRLIEALPDKDRLSQIATGGSLLRASVDVRLADAVAAHLSVDRHGLLGLDCSAAQSLPLAKLLGILLQVAAGSDRPAERDQLESLSEVIRAGGPDKRLTLGGAWLQRRCDELLIGRDPGEAKLVWQKGVFDGRFAKADASPAPETGEAIPFLVRETQPKGGYCEILSARLDSWAGALRLNAELTGSYEAVYQTPRLSPVQT